MRIKLRGIAMSLAAVIAALGVGPLSSCSGSLEGKVIDEQTQVPITNAYRHRR
jgi:hypothetical protein